MTPKEYLNTVEDYYSFHSQGNSFSPPFKNLHPTAKAYWEKCLEAELLRKKLDKYEAVMQQALEALSLALSDVDWRADSPAQPVIHKAYTALSEALKGN